MPLDPDEDEYITIPRGPNRTSPKWANSPPVWRPFLFAGAITLLTSRWEDREERHSWPPCCGQLQSGGELGGFPGRKGPGPSSSPREPADLWHHRPAAFEYDARIRFIFSPFAPPPGAVNRCSSGRSSFATSSSSARPYGGHRRDRPDLLLFPPAGAEGSPDPSHAKPSKNPADPDRLRGRRSC